MSDLKDLQRKSLVVANHYDDYNRKLSGKTWDLNDYVDGLVGDVGDLVKAIMAVRGRREIPDALDRVEHELNDILWSLLLLYKFFQLDPDRSFIKAMSMLEKRVVKMKKEISPEKFV